LCVRSRKELNLVQYETGVVSKWWNDRGYGFIRNEKRGDVFLHRSSITDLSGNPDQPLVMKGDRVTFEVIERERGHEAIHVQVDGNTLRRRARPAG